ncbi:MAG: hypothetical protein ACK53V_16255, partial [Planctomycetota bacterium]
VCLFGWGNRPSAVPQMRREHFQQLPVICQPRSPFPQGMPELSQANARTLAGEQMFGTARGAGN